MKTTQRWLLSVPGKHKLKIAILILVQSMNGASGVLYALILKNIVDAAVGGDGAGFKWQLIAITILVIIQQLLRAVIRWLEELSRASFENCFKARLFDSILTRDYIKTSSVHSGEWMNRLTSDTVVVANGFVEIVPGIAGMIVKLVSAVAMIIALEPLFAAVLLPSGILLLVFATLFRRILKKLHRNVQEADGRLRIFLQERISSLLMIRSFAVEERTKKDAEVKMNEHKAARMNKTRFWNFCNVGFGTAMSGMYLLGVGWCGYGILKGTISFGTLTAITQLISQIQFPFANITGYFPRYYAMLSSAERLMEAESFEETAAEVPEAGSADFVKIGLEDVGFQYYAAADRVENISKEGMPPAVRNLSFEIMRGEVTAFTGQSGCGKSTALRLLMCVYEPDSGRRYYIDGAGNRNPMTIRHRKLFSYVPQGNQLMSGSIREIVSFADPEAGHDEYRIQKAIRTACADEFVNDLEKGVDTVLGERGTGLSEGQMQRIAIARALFSEAPVLLLDESTSALDSDTEMRLLENLRKLKDKTVIIVTHRTAALSICDRVLHFTEDGVTEV